jgi:hypothetical protein
VTACRSKNCNLVDYIDSLTKGGHWSQEHGKAVADRLEALGYDLATAGEPAKHAPEPLLFYCAGPSCPGLPFRASQHAHPAACALEGE